MFIACTTSARTKKARKSKSKFKTLMNVFFSIFMEFCIFTAFLKDELGNNQHFSVHVLAELREGLRNKTLELWTDMWWVLHQRIAQLIAHCLSGD